MPIKLFPVLGLFVCLLTNCGNKKSSEKADKPQNKDYLVSMDGIDSIKLEMNKAELEKILKTKLQLPNCAVDRGGDTVKVKYRNMDMILFMYGSDDSTATLRFVQTADPSCKTAAGMGPGAGKMTVIDAYPDNTKFVGPVYDVYPARSTSRTIVAVVDTMTTRAIVFHIINKKAALVEVCSYYEYE